MDAGFARFDFGGETLHFDAPVGVLEARDQHSVRDVIRDAEEAARRGLWAAGFVAYEAAPAFDSALRVPDGYAGPLAWFALFDGPSAGLRAPRGPAAEPASWQAGQSADAHAAAVSAIRDGAARGDWYQVNHTMRLHAAYGGDPYEWYQKMRSAHRPPWAGYIEAGPVRILSLSPELFFQRTGAAVRVRPMKGTMARGRWPAEDAAHAAVLSASAKDRAENLMIVDLLRNDLGRVAVPGTVVVESLFDIERYPSVYQMTSTVSASLRGDLSTLALFDAMFPSGSVTGAPKVAAMAAIAGLEHEPRGVYCGAVGYIAPGDRATFNVGIRTVVIDTARGDAAYGAGGAITWASDAGAEHDELLAKTDVLSPVAPFSLIETMRLEHRGIALRERHVARILESAGFFDMPCDAGEIARVMDAAAEAHGAGAWRVRLELDGEGRMAVTCERLAEPATEPARAGLAPVAIESGNRFAYHKTSNREHLDCGQPPPGVFDRLFLNERGEIAEFGNGNVVLALDGRLVTPPRECGVLAGTLRAHLLERGRIVEAPLRIDDWRRAEHRWRINSVRGWTEVDVALHGCPETALAFAHTALV